MEPHAESETESMNKTAKKAPTNLDRLTPRGNERKSKRQLEADANTSERKKRKEGHEEMEKLKTLVPNLRLRDGRISQVDIIEETITYIDELHRRIAERLAGDTDEINENDDDDDGDSDVRLLTLEQIQRAETASHEEEFSSDMKFTQRLANLSKSLQGDRIESTEVEIEDSPRISDTVGESSASKTPDYNDGDNVIKHVKNNNLGGAEICEHKEETKEDDTKLTDEQNIVIEAVKASFVAFLENPSANNDL